MMYVRCLLTNTLIYYCCPTIYQSNPEVCPANGQIRMLLFCIQESQQQASKIFDRQNQRSLLLVVYVPVVQMSFVH
jgi:hypothetical protein